MIFSMSSATMKVLRLPQPCTAALLLVIKHVTHVFTHLKGGRRNSDMAAHNYRMDADIAFAGIYSCTAVRMWLVFVVRRKSCTASHNITHSSHKLHSHTALSTFFCSIHHYYSSTQNVCLQNRSCIGGYMRCTCN